MVEGHLIVGGVCVCVCCGRCSPSTVSLFPIIIAARGLSRKAQKQQTSPLTIYSSPAAGDGDGPEKDSPRSGGKGDLIGKGKKGPVRKMQGIPLKEDGRLTQV